MPDTSVKRINESMRGAPTLNGMAGSRIAVLDAFLVSGWGSATAASATVSSGVCTVNMPAGMGFEADCVVSITGAAAIAGEHRTLTGGDTFTFSTTAPNGAVSGTIDVKYAPCGWEKPFSGTNLAVYRSQNIMGSRRFLRVQDAAGIDARVVAYNNMTGVSTGTGAFPTNAQISGGGYWVKSATADATPQRYDIVGDDMLFYDGVCAYYAMYGGGDTYASAMYRPFGDPLTLKPSGDAWGCVLGVSKNPSAYSHQEGCIDIGQQPGVFVERAMSGMGGSIETYMLPEVGSATAFSGEDAYGFGPFPGSVDGRMRLSKQLIRAATNDFSPRSVCPGIWRIPHSGVPSSGLFKARDTIQGPGVLAGRKLMLLLSGVGMAYGGFFVDITGPWR